VICKFLKGFLQRVLRTPMVSRRKRKCFVQKSVSLKELNGEGQMKNLCELCDLSERKKNGIKRVISDL